MLLVLVLVLALVPEQGQLQPRINAGAAAVRCSHAGAAATPTEHQSRCTAL
jgi:hypothetical protein